MSDRWNPIFVFEIRQVVRNRLVLGALCLYLVLLIALLGYELLSASQLNLLGSDSYFGAELTRKILWLLNNFSIGILLVHSATTAINQGFHDELLFQTPISSFTAGLGKTYSAVLITSLFYAVTLPFLTTAWMLRGVDILTLFLTLFCFFVLAQAINVHIASAFFRCRDTNHLLATGGGLICASPPLLLVWFLSCSSIVLLTGGLVNILVTLYWSAMIALMAAFIGSEMFRVMNRPLLPAYQRFCYVACFTWLENFLVIYIGGIIFILFMFFTGIIMRLLTP